MRKDSNTKNNHSQKIVLSTVLVMLLFISVIGITYAIFTYAKEGKVANKISTGSLTFSYTETSNGISLTNAVPVSDTVGKAMKNGNGYFDFSVSCKIVGTNVIKYEVYTTEENVSSKLDSAFVKIYLTDGTTDKPLSGYDGTIPTYNSLPATSISGGSKRLYLGTFNSTGVQSFRLRMWLAESYSVSSNSQQFKIKVNVKANN